VKKTATRGNCLAVALWGKKGPGIFCVFVGGRGCLFGCTGLT